MEENKPRKVIVVLGAGRCGTSLLMQVLSSLGMSLSEKLMPAKAHNPIGPMEDLELSEIYNEILKQIGSNRVLPIDKNIFASDIQDKIVSKFRIILQKNFNDKTTIWGFKDPYTSILLPFWFRAFNLMNVTPVFLLAVRDPSHAVISREKHFNVAKETGELAWLINFTDALNHTSADCFILHYEDWFSRPQELAKELLDYTGLNEFFGGDVSEAIKDVIKPNLNRSVHEEYSIKNEMVLRLYQILKNCHGATFEKDRLMVEVKRCGTAIDGFKGWSMEAQRFLKQKTMLQERLKQHSKSKEGPIKKLDFEGKSITIQEDIGKMVAINNSYLEEIRNLHDEVSNLERNKALLEKEREQKTILQKHFKQHSELKMNFIKNSKPEGKITTVQKDMQKLAVMNNSYLKKIRDLSEEVSNFEIQKAAFKKEEEKKAIQIEALVKEKRQNEAQIEALKRELRISIIQKKNIRKELKIALAKAEKKAVALQTSTSFRVGKLATEAFSKPGKNTILLPFRFLKLILRFMLGSNNK